jgi:DNA-binding MarR family transcriptional regulator
MIPALQQAALDPTLTGRRFQIYVYLCGRLDPVEYRHIKFASESRTLGIACSKLSPIIKHLVTRGYIQTTLDKQDRRRRRYRLRYSLGGG